jgi:hypothetical protein
MRHGTRFCRERANAKSASRRPQEAARRLGSASVGHVDGHALAEVRLIFGAIIGLVERNVGGGGPAPVRQPLELIAFDGLIERRGSAASGERTGSVKATIAFHMLHNCVAVAAGLLH